MLTRLSSARGSRRSSTFRGRQSATAWIQIHVIQPEVAAGRGELAARLRMVSSVGAGAAQAILKADTRLPIREAEKLFERQLKLHLKFDNAVELTTDTDKARMFFIGQHAKLKREEQRMKFVREKLEKKCAEALDRHEVTSNSRREAGFGPWSAGRERLGWCHGGPVGKIVRVGKAASVQIEASGQARASC